MPNSFGLIVEGTYDAAVFEVIVKKLTTQDVTVISRPCGGVPALKKTFPAILHELQTRVVGQPVDKAIVIRDADGNDSGLLEAELARRVAHHRYAFPEGVKFHAVRQQMDAWLLADENAISVLSMRRGRRRTVAAVNEELEAILRPKDRLRQLLLGAGLPYTPEVCREIIAEANLARIAERCPSFRVFSAKVIDC